jgi:hypothetical protein
MQLNRIATQFESEYFIDYDTALGWLEELLEEA